MTEDKLKYYKTEKGYAAMTAWYDSLLEKFPFEFESMFLETRFGQTHALVTGDASAPPLILVQGVSGSAPLWRYQLRDLAANFRVFALDIPGQPGKSASHALSFLDESYSHWLLDVLDALDYQSAHFGGISAGGWIVLKLGIFQPDRVRKAIMMSPTGLVQARLPVKIWFNNVLRKNKDVDTLEDSLTARSYSPPSASQEFDRQVARAMALATRHYRVDLSLGVYNEKTRRVHVWQALKVLRQFFWAAPKSTLRQFKGPGLLIMGESETLYNVPKAAKRAQALLPQVRVEIIPEAGHTAVYDLPQIINPLITAYLQDRLV